MENVILSLCSQIQVFERQGKAHFTPLVPDLKGLDPDDVYSCIPYEKGCSFLFYLETLLGGPGHCSDTLFTLRAYVCQPILCDMHIEF